MTTDSACSWREAGVWTNDARLGTTSAATASAIDVVIMLARAVLKVWVPLRSPPATNARPRTSSRLARIEPTIAACTTVTRPWRSAKMPMNSSGRLPRALCRTPVAPAPSRSAIWSTARPTSSARTAMAAPARTKAVTSPRLA